MISQSLTQSSSNHWTTKCSFRLSYVRQHCLIMICMCTLTSELHLVLRKHFKTQIFWGGHGSAAALTEKWEMCLIQHLVFSIQPMYKTTWKINVMVNNSYIWTAVHQTNKYRTEDHDKGEFSSKSRITSVTITTFMFVC